MLRISPISPCPLNIWSILVIITAFISQGCDSPTTINTRYSPLHPPNNEEIEFFIRAEDDNGISQIELYLYEYELFSVIFTGEVKARRRIGGVWGLVNSWSGDDEVSIEKQYTKTPGFGANTLLTFLAEITDSKGNKKNECWSFAVGNWPFDGHPVPLWINDDPAKRFDMAFVAQEDEYDSPRDLLEPLEDLIFEGYHESNGIIPGKMFWQFYYSQGTASKSGATLTKPVDLETTTIIDYIGLMHPDEYGDNAYRTAGFFTSEENFEGTAVHEAAHMAFNLADEKGASRGHWTEPDFDLEEHHHNNFLNKELCEDYNAFNSWIPNDCELIGTNGEGTWWSPEKRLECIMWDDGNRSLPDFQRSCIAKIMDIYKQMSGE